MASNTASGWLSVGQGWMKTSKAGRRLTASSRKPGSRRSTPPAHERSPASSGPSPRMTTTASGRSRAASTISSGRFQSTRRIEPPSTVAVSGISSWARASSRERRVGRAMPLAMTWLRTWSWSMRTSSALVHSEGSTCMSTPRRMKWPSRRRMPLSDCVGRCAVVTMAGVRSASADMMAYCAACEWESMAWNTTGRAARMARKARAKPRRSPFPRMRSSRTQGTPRGMSSCSNSSAMTPSTTGSKRLRSRSSNRWRRWRSTPPKEYPSTK